VCLEATKGTQYLMNEQRPLTLDTPLQLPGTKGYNL